MIKFIRKIRAFFNIPLLVSLLIGAALPLAFAPFHYWFVSIIALAMLIELLNNCTPGRAFARGLAFGFGAFGTGISWVYIAIRYFGNAAPVLSVLLTSLLVLYCALFPALACYIQRKYFKDNALSFASIWVLSEWVRGWLFSGFPWLFVGYSQMSWLGGFAPIGGIYLMSFITVFSAYLLTRLKVRPIVAISFLSAIFLFGYFGQHIAWTAPNHKTLKVSLLQGNIAKELKWNPQQIMRNIHSYANLTKVNIRSDLIVWPEGTFSVPQTYGQPIIHELTTLAKKHHSTIALGIPYVDDNRFYNSLLLIGQSHGLYSKRHLVPFGEYTPLEKLLAPLISWLQIPMSNFAAGADDQALLTVKGITIAPFVCYEIVYPNLVLRDLPKANILLTISEDVWYGDSIAVDQHLQMAQMRSLESGRYSLFAVNTGISAIIDQHGKVIKSIPLHKRGVITRKVPAIEGATPWVMIGNWPWLMAMFLLLIFVLRSHKIRKKTPVQ